MAEWEFWEIFEQARPPRSLVAKLCNRDQWHFVCMIGNRITPKNNVKTGLLLQNVSSSTKKCGLIVEIHVEFFHFLVPGTKIYCRFFYIAQLSLKPLENLLHLVNCIFEISAVKHGNLKNAAKNRPKKTTSKKESDLIKCLFLNESKFQPSDRGPQNHRCHKT